ncbi:MAG: AmmeMemoRadiSam system protein B [Elusimicrobiales bacterium]|jgi:hypothetical protein
MKNIALVFAVVLSGVCATGAAREPAFAGKFYPADKQELARFVDSVLAAAGPSALQSFYPPAAVRAIVVPHAGYPFSGLVAAFAYKMIDTGYDLVVILGTGHTMRVRGAALLAKGYYETPLGRVPVDEKFSAGLIKASPLFEDLPEAHAGEHSIEVQLPFLQRRLKKPFKLAAAVLNTDDPALLAEIGRILGGKLKGRKALLIVSTDFSHYPSHADAKRADETLALAIKTMTPEFFRLTSRLLLGKGIPELGTCACGEAALTAAMTAVNTLGPAQFLELKYADSYDEYPAQSSPDRVVGYLAGAFVPAASAPPAKILLALEQQKELLKAARAEIKAKLLGTRADRERLSADYAFNLPGAVFVTLTEDGALRGCVGTVEPRTTLLDAVRYAALSAAFEDRRFKPVEKGELEKLKIEISVLSPLKKITGAGDITPHKHGVVVVRETGKTAGASSAREERRSGLFLPQVWEQIPGKEDFLDELCSQKAGLERNCWRDAGTGMYTFTVDSFKE